MEAALVVFAFGVIVGGMGIWFAINADAKLKTDVKAERERIQAALFEVRCVPGAPPHVREAIDKLMETMD